MSPLLPAKAFYGWTVVGAAFVVAVFGWGVGFYGPPVYLKAVQDARGWSVGLVSAAVTVHFLAGALVVANLARHHQRLGLPQTTVCGATSLAFGVLGGALAREPWQLFAATLLSGAGWAALGAAGINAMVSPWFIRRRPAALATAYNGASVGGALFSPLWVMLIAWAGFPLAAAARRRRRSSSSSAAFRRWRRWRISREEESIGTVERGDPHSLLTPPLPGNVIAPHIVK